MRLVAVAPLVLVTLATCAPSSPPPETRAKDLPIDVTLALDGNKCVLRFEDPRLKDPARAVAWTAHAVIWNIKSNACGEKKKVSGKALGLKHLKFKKTGEDAPWAGQCSRLDYIPAHIQTPLQIRCDIPPSNDLKDDGIYEYEIDGDTVEPGDPGLDVKRNG